MPLALHNRNSNRHILNIFIFEIDVQTGRNVDFSSKQDNWVEHPQFEIQGSSERLEQSFWEYRAKENCQT